MAVTFWFVWFGMQSFSQFTHITWWTIRPVYHLFIEDYWTAAIVADMDEVVITTHETTGK